MKRLNTSVFGLYGSDSIPLGNLDVPDGGLEFVKRKILDSFEGYLENGPPASSSYELRIGRNGDWESLGHFRPEVDLRDGLSMDEYIKGYSKSVIGFTLGPRIFLRYEPGRDMHKVVLTKL